MGKHETAGRVVNGGESEGQVVCYVVGGVQRCRTRLSLSQWQLSYVTSFLDLEGTLYIHRAVPFLIGEVQCWLYGAINFRFTSSLLY